MLDNTRTAIMLIDLLLLLFNPDNASRIIFPNGRLVSSTRFEVDNPIVYRVTTFELFTTCHIALHLL